MAKITKTQVDKNLREKVFDELVIEGWDLEDNLPIIKEGFHKINDRQYGVLMIDLNGHQRYVRVSAIVAEERDDMTAEELMQSEIDTYNQKQADKAEKAKAKEKKIVRDKARREAEAKAKESETNA
jgi:hypothetical protein